MTAHRSLAGFEIKSNEPLKPYTTFKIGGAARYFAKIERNDHLHQALDFAKCKNLALFVLGGGSNILISDGGFNGLVLHIARRGMSIVSEDAGSATFRINAAETWDEVVRYAVEQEWWGIENLSHIPGQAGAALVQNIGAYGAQISDVLQGAEVMDIETRAVISLGIDDCQMAYRTSIFNTSRKGKFIILSLTLKLAKQGDPNLQYPDVRTYFGPKRMTQPTLHEIRQTIIAIRDVKFPFPREEKGGNVGSFFKNLLLTQAEYETLEISFQKHFSGKELLRLRELRAKFPSAGRIKVPTAFLMEVCGLRRCRVGGVQVNERQPLVLLNQGGATARNVLTLVRHIRQTIYQKTGMVIAIEPELVGFSQAELADYLALN